ncbi:MAG: sigma 54 modulation/S30EA ribosomal C-terminal domain-containing protein [Pseudonocardia sp.]|nr:sigma 54 modulation/S30EA ribosomal C-terminal domain-containing protein [Pseudonocardia sp.]
MDPTPRIVREMEHSAESTPVDQALHEMELVGHDFYLFVDACTGLPSVVYRRASLRFGVIRLV